MVGWLLCYCLLLALRKYSLTIFFSASWSKPRDNDSLKPNGASFLSPRICTYTYMYVHLYVCMYVHSRSFVGQRNGLFSSFSSHKGKKIMYLQNSIWSKMASAKHKSAVSPCRMRHLVCMYVWMYVRMYVCICEVYTYRSIDKFLKTHVSSILNMNESLQIEIMRETCRMPENDRKMCEKAVSEKRWCTIMLHCTTKSRVCFSTYLCLCG